MSRVRVVLVSLFAAALLFGTGGPSRAGVAMTIAVAPPPLPVYAQPPIPGPGYLWTPGYWGYGTAG